MRATLKKIRVGRLLQRKAIIQNDLLHNNLAQLYEAYPQSGGIWMDFLSVRCFVVYLFLRGVYWDNRAFYNILPDL
jgi:hypothetical protein